MTKYLQYFPKPLLDDLANGRWLPVIGAGMSLNASLPAGKAMPLWGDLGKAFERDLADFSAVGPVDAMSAYEHEYGRARLIERLSELLHLRDALPGEAHRAFCSIKFDLVCTTNFDFLLERQYESIPRFVNPVVDEEQLSLNVAADGTVLLKLHGDLRHPSRLVVTEADYDAFLTRYPLIATYLANLLITKTAVLIGYSLDDPDFRQIWQVVNQRLGKTRRQAYAIAVGAQSADVARYARRGVTLINLPKGKKKYGEVLAAAFDELAAFWRNTVLEVSTVTEEAPLRELKLPREASSRLIFFAVPLHRLPIYRERVFPSVEGIGLVPVTADDVVSPGDSISAKIDALMDRAVAIVVEVGSSWTAAELRLALSRSKEVGSSAGRAPLVIQVGKTRSPIVSSEPSLSLLLTIETVTDDEQGLQRLLDALRNVAPSVAEQEHEPERLLEAEEYRAAVISAISLLEGTLRRALDKPDWSRVRRPMSMSQLLELAMSQQLVDLPDPALIKDWVKIRNNAVHTNTGVSREVAKTIVDGVLGLVAQIAPELR
ncbi:SIR2 family NAD-dependent protein deacylase [Rhizobium leguminosarum]|uniref:SIR2 family NAD-dependent protein deacylase n=1 Tax=Rhizobium leguminosarum TaxID=384 RepID=UPI001C93EC06|nr:SIR2 family protein [Rhizobium leguminosarum]MBY5416153.1 SIR2 family protein [Rhizobium leguminosarum]